MKRTILTHPIVSRLARQGDLANLTIGWGYKRSGIRAKNSGKPFLIFEDGFIRSLFPGYKHGLPFSLISDSTGIYFDYSNDSDLSLYLNGEVIVGEQWQKTISKEYTLHALERVRKTGISKYNCHLNKNRTFKLGILVVDQTSGDTAIAHSGMRPENFDRMLQDAIDEHPESTIYVKTHPDHEYRKKHSCFSNTLLKHPSVSILPADMPANEAFKFCHTVYVGSSLLGMEALIHKRQVISYSWTFYTGWGLTTDRCSAKKPKRNKTLRLEELFEAAYLRYTRYFDPDTLEPCDIHRVIDHILLQWDHWLNRQKKWIYTGLTPLNRKLLALYLGPKQASLQAEQKYEHTNSCQLITWGAKDIPKRLKKLPLTRIEDGFIRSNGLGANFNFPLSWVFDDVGIYFDARSPSKLENLLNEHLFTEDEISQTKELIIFLRDNKLTKYNLGLQKATLPQKSKGKKVILIPGQVDSDASIKYGSPKLSNNRELLTEVRQQNPDSFICYKPHPDLLRGARKDAPLWESIENDVDHLILEGDIISWIHAVDEVHTLTSTVGFEALLHNKPVYTYGLPFYADWGLTHDWLKCERRKTTRSLEELACATLILYPTYLNPITKEFTTALNAAKLLANPDFKYDSRSGFLKIVGKLKSLYYRIARKF